jgi:hypothetical protein
LQDLFDCAGGAFLVVIAVDICRFSSFQALWTMSA